MIDYMAQMAYIATFVMIFVYLEMISIRNMLYDTIIKARSKEALVPEDPNVEDKKRNIRRG